MKPLTSIAPTQSEGDVNLSSRRRRWQAEHLDDAARALLARDGAAFLHQSVSTPCLNAIRRAEGIWIEDLGGRRYMDFHGNNVHHVGYAHPHVIAAIKAVMNGEMYLSSNFPQTLLGSYAKFRRRGKKADQFALLTKREREILQYIAEGYTSPKIAQALFISRKTVENHRANIMEKLGIHDTAGLVRYALKIGLVD